MAFEKPTLNTLRETAEADTASRFGLSALLPRSVLLVLSRVLAGLAHGLYGRLSWISRQILPDTADADHLARYASMFKVNRLPSTPATGSVIVTGAELSEIPDGTLLRRSDAVEFATVGLQVIPLASGGLLSAFVTGVAGGATENTPTAIPLTFVEPIAGVESETVVKTPGLAGATDAETDAALLARLLVRLQNPPQGGAVADYLGWCLELPGVTRAYVFPNHLGAGSVGITFAVDLDPTGPIPTPTQVTVVQNYLDDPARKPIGAAVTVFQPVATPVVFQITLIPDDPTVRAAIEANLVDLVRREAGPGETLLLSHISEAISTTPGEVDHVVSLPASNLVIGAGNIGEYLGVTWL